MQAHLILYFVIFYMHMADLTFNFEIHHGGQFMWNPDLVYLVGSTSFYDEVDPDRLSYFEIQDMCCALGANSKVDFIILFLEVIWS